MVSDNVPPHLKLTINQVAAVTWMRMISIGRVGSMPLPISPQWIDNGYRLDIVTSLQIREIITCGRCEDMGCHGSDLLRVRSNKSRTLFYLFG